MIPKREPSLSGTGNGGYRSQSFLFLVELRHLADVHFVDVITAENGQLFRTKVVNEVQILENSIRCTVVPALVVILHLGRNWHDKLPFNQT